MHNIWTLFKSDLRHLFANVVSTIITIGLVVMPSIFAWYNLIACWDVFDNTGHLTVAVANEDEGYESDLVPIRVNVGDMLVSELRANDQIGWRIVSEEEAVDGAKSGKYYAAVVIPKDFSRDMLRFYMDDSERAQITYYSNEKKNAISPKITMTGADTVSEKVNTVFAQSISEVMLSVAESVSRYADDMDVHGQIAALADHINAMSEDTNRVADVVEMYSGTLESAQRLLDSGSKLIRQAQDEIVSMMETADASADGLTSAAEDIAAAQGKLEEALSSAQASFDELRALIDSSGLSQLLDPEVVQRIDQLAASAQANIQAARKDYNENLKPDLDRLIAAAKGLDADASQAISGMKEAESGISAATDSAQGILGDAVAQIGSVTGDLRVSADTLHGLATSISEALVTGDPAALQAVLGADAQSMAEALSAPVGIERIAVFPSENFGSAMAPFYNHARRLHRVAAHTRRRQAERLESRAGESSQSQAARDADRALSLARVHLARADDAHRHRQHLLLAGSGRASVAPDARPVVLGPRLHVPDIRPRACICQSWKGACDLPAHLADNRLWRVVSLADPARFRAEREPVLAGDSHGRCHACGDVRHVQR